MSKVARAELTLTQVQTLLEGRPIRVRLRAANIEVEIVREPLRDKTIACVVTNTRLSPTCIDHLFNNFEDFFQKLGQVFRL